MNPPATPMFNQCRKWLTQVRTDHSTWDCLVAVPDPPQGETAAQLRMRLFWALYYDLRPEDADLCRFLLEQEVALHNQVMGAGPAMAMAAYLVASLRRPENALLLFRATGCSFDTAMHLAHPGIIFSAGVSPTLDAIQAANDRATRKEFDRQVKEDLLRVPTDEAVSGWEDFLRGRLTRFLDPPDRIAEAERALGLGFADEAVSLLEALESDSKYTQRLPQIAYLWKVLGRPEKALELGKQAISTQPEGLMATVLKRVRVHELIDANRPDEAWGTLLSAVGEGIHDIGPPDLRPKTVHDAFRIASRLPKGHTHIGAVFALAEQLLQEGAPVFQALLEEGLLAAEKHERTWLAERCRSALALLQKQEARGIVSPQNLLPAGFFDRPTR